MPATDSRRSTRRSARSSKTKCAIFACGGAELPEEKKTRFKAIQERLSDLASKFSDNLLDATNAFVHYVGHRRRSLPAFRTTCSQAAREAAQAEGKTGWKFTLHAPSYMPVHAIRR